MRRAVQLLCLIVPGVAGCGSDARLEALYGGAGGLQPLRAPVKVETFRVDPVAVQPNDPREALGGYPIIAGPVELDGQTARELAALLTDPDTYEWNSAKACEFVPGVAVRFTGEGETTVVVFCFACDSLEVFRNGQSVGGRDFDRSRGRFLRIFQRVFPDDEAIQALK